MEKLLQTLIITAALISAFVLFLLGIRKLKINPRKKYGLFMTSLILAISFSGCKIPFWPFSKTIESPPLPSEINVQTNSARVTALNQTTEWQAFKTFWQELDQIPPQTAEITEEERFFKDEYTNSIPIEKVNAYASKLDILLRGLENLESNLITDFENELLQTLCVARINHLSVGPGAAMFSRMFIPFLEQKTDLIQSLERKIDILLALRKNEKIDSAEFQQAILNLQKDIDQFLSYEYLSHNYWLIAAEPNQNFKSYTELLDQYLPSLENAYQKTDQQMQQEPAETYQDFQANYQLTKQKVLELKAALPALNELIADLVSHD